MLPYLRVLKQNARHESSTSLNPKAQPFSRRTPYRTGSSSSNNEKKEKLLDDKDWIYFPERLRSQIHPDRVSRNQEEAEKAKWEFYEAYSVPAKEGLGVQAPNPTIHPRYPKGSDIVGTVHGSAVGLQFKELPQLTGKVSWVTQEFERIPLQKQKEQLERYLQSPTKTELMYERHPPVSFLKEARRVAAEAAKTHPPLPVEVSLVEWKYPLSRFSKENLKSLIPPQVYLIFNRQYFRDLFNKFLTFLPFVSRRRHTEEYNEKLAFRKRALTISYPNMTPHHLRVFMLTTYFPAFFKALFALDTDTVLTYLDPPARALMRLMILDMKTNNIKVLNKFIKVKGLVFSSRFSPLREQLRLRVHVSILQTRGFEMNGKILEPSSRKRSRWKFRMIYRANTGLRITRIKGNFFFKEKRNRYNMELMNPIQLTTLKAHALTLKTRLRNYLKGVHAMAISEEETKRLRKQKLERLRERREQEKKLLEEERKKPRPQSVPPTFEEIVEGVWMDMGGTLEELKAAQEELKKEEEEKAKADAERAQRQKEAQERLLQEREKKLLESEEEGKEEGEDEKKAKEEEEGKEEEKEEEGKEAEKTKEEEGKEAEQTKEEEEDTKETTEETKENNHSKDGNQNEESKESKS